MTTLQANRHGRGSHRHQARPLAPSVRNSSTWGRAAGDGDEPPVVGSSLVTPSVGNSPSRSFSSARLPTRLSLSAASHSTPDPVKP